MASSAGPRASILSGAAAVRAACDAARAAPGGRVAFVPTMGALHDGHLSLVREAARRAPFVVVSIFVNPTQFGPGEDFTRYPRDLEGDVEKVAGAGATLVFAPDAAEMYPPGDATRVRVGAVASPLEGEHRPGHFEGVATVVAKLFGVVGPCAAVFGQKDFQQLAVVRRMTRDLFLPVEIVGHPIVRETDGLAMSSRNAYLSAAERTRALALSRGLDAAGRLFQAGERRREELERAARAPVEAAASSIDYVAARDPETLEVPPGPDVGARVVMLIACRIGSTRLIDNRVLGP